MRKLAFTLLLVFTAAGAYTQNKVKDSLQKGIVRLRQLIAHASNPTTEVNLLDSLSADYAWSFPDSCLLYGRRALAIAQKINYPLGIARSESSICVGFAVLGNYPQAVNYGLKSIDLFKKIDDPGALFVGLENVGLFYREQGDYKKSIAYYYMALDLNKRFHLPVSKYAGWCGMISAAYAKNHQPDSALFYGQKAYKYQQQWSGLTYALGNAYAQKGEFKPAMDFYKKTITLAPGGSEIDLLDAYNGMAGLFLQKAQTDSAVYYAKKALYTKWGKIYPIGVFHAAELLTSIYEKGKVTDSTLKYLKMTIALKDGLYSSQKERDIQNINFNNQLQQQALDQQRNKAQTRLILISLAGGMFTLLIIGFMQWRSNKHKQKAYSLLKKQKQETDAQKEKVEKALEELKTTQNQLVQSAKMASLGELTAGIAHEIQNPLNFVNNFSEVSAELVDEMDEELDNGDVAEAKAISADIKQNLEKIRHHGKRADGIVKSMLEHSRASTGQKQVTDINKLADEYFRLAYHGLRAKDKTFNAELITHFYEKLPSTNAIPQDIGRVLLNILNNAFYAVNEKSKTVGTDYKPTVEVSTAKENGSIVIKVKDNGNGIPDAIKDKIMQPFFTTKPTGEGTGLGLSLSYDIVVKGHGGSIAVASKESEGSEFKISLPIN